MKIKEIVLFDMNTAYAPAMSEQYEALYICLAEQAKKLRSDDGPICLIVNTDIGQILVTPSSFAISPVMLKINAIIEYQGVLNKRWDVWFDYWMPTDEVWVCTNSEKIKISVQNYIR